MFVHELTDVVEKLQVFGWRQTNNIQLLVNLVADVAELADALDSKSSIFTDVWVRPPPSAPY
jgi:hypothetical protein